MVNTLLVGLHVLSCWRAVLHSYADRTNYQADKLRTQQELDRLQSKFLGTGHADTTSWEWQTNLMRDTYASIVGHYPLLYQLVVAENEPAIKARHRTIIQMLQPAGPPMPTDDDDRTRYERVPSS